MAYICLRDVTVDFPVVTSSTQSLQLKLFEALGGKLTAHDRTVVITALDRINLELAEGDRLGIIGHNGAGKTTLLRVLAGVYPPDRGSVTIEGTVSSFTDIVLGMDPESTGWENILFRCAFMGLSYKQARELSPAIADFSELGYYLELPTRTYSTGMFLRLAFAISTSIQPDILIMDEMISTGDAQFMQKAERRLNDLIGKTNVLALASHELDLIRKMCNKVAWLEHGQIKQIGPTEAVTAAYKASHAPNQTVHHTMDAGASRTEWATDLLGRH